MIEKRRIAVVPCICLVSLISAVALSRLPHLQLLMDRDLMAAGEVTVEFLHDKVIINERRDLVSLGSIRLDVQTEEIVSASLRAPSRVLHLTLKNDVEALFYPPKKDPAGGDKIDSLLSAYRVSPEEFSFLKSQTRIEGLRDALRLKKAVCRVSVTKVLFSNTDKSLVLILWEPSRAEIQWFNRSEETVGFVQVSWTKSIRNNDVINRCEQIVRSANCGNDSDANFSRDVDLLLSRIGMPSGTISTSADRPVQ